MVGGGGNGGWGVGICANGQPCKSSFQSCDFTDHSWDRGLFFLVDLDKVDEIITISTEDAKNRAKELCQKNGLFVGISAGANVLASERWIKENNPKGIIFTILCDRGERYCSILDS